jgi:hypothetical protein
MEVDSLTGSELELLASWRGAAVRVWRYHASLSRLWLCLSRGASEKLFVVAGGCDHVRGPFSWRDGALDIVEIRDVHGLPAIALVDVRAEFELRCRAIALYDTDTFEDD